MLNRKYFSSFFSVNYYQKKKSSLTPKNSLFKLVDEKKSFTKIIRKSPYKSESLKFSDFLHFILYFTFDNETTSEWVKDYQRDDIENFVDIVVDFNFPVYHCYNKWKRWRRNVLQCKQQQQFLLQRPQYLPSKSYFGRWLLQVPPVWSQFQFSCKPST